MDLQIFIGYDSREPLPYHVLAHSIVVRASNPVPISPVALHQLGRVYTRQRGPTEATEFSLTRFLVPHLSGYEGFSIFMDCDMLAKVDINDIWLHILANPDKAVLVCRHDYIPKQLTKMDGKEQTTYPCKNWSSFMVFNNRLCTSLTPEYVNKASGLDLHRFNWLKPDQIGSLPLDWNWLVGEYEQNPQAKILHYTNGGPWFPDYQGCDHAEDWLSELGTIFRPQVPPC